MPKELLHWWLATEAVRRLPLDRPARQLLEDQQAAFLTGAVVPDSLLHLLHSPYSETARQLADTFHDSSQHCYAPLLNFLDRQPDLSPADQACLLGIATHIEVDSIFHPFVYAQAGQNQGRHYRVETDLDLWLLHHGQRPPVLTLQDLMTDASHNAACRMLAGIFDPGGLLPAQSIDEALQQHARLQARYGSAGWQLLARILGLLPGTPFHHWQHLFYPSNWQAGRAVQWPRHWQHPGTGNQRGDTPEGLMTEAISRITTLLRNVDDCGMTAALRKQPGENLLTGLPPVATPT